MLKTNLKIIAIVLFVVVLFVIGLAKQQAVNTASSVANLNLQQRATTIAQIDLIITRSELDNRQGLSEFLNELESLSSLAGWQLTDQRNIVLGEKKATANADPSPQHLYFYRDEQKESLLGLKLYFFEPTQVPIWSLWDFVIAAASAAAIAVLLAFLFKWVFNLEQYATYLLTDNQSIKRNQIDSFSNPVSRIINQLILQNSLLQKDKQDLTDQIRKISYVDEVTELGNHLFFKAEFQVRLHNHEEEESGLFVLLSFIDPQDDDVQIVDDDKLRQIANVLKQFSSDISNSLVARLHDKDFAILLPNQSRKATDNLCKTLIHQLEKTVFDKTSIREHFVDIGISAYKHGFDYYKIMAEADMALRNAQLQGGNNWFMFGETLPENKVRGHMRWRSFLQRILDKRQLKLYGQTIHYFDDSAEIHKEVLVRIEEENDVLSAQSFLPMASSCGLATSFDRQVVDGVIKHCLYQDTTKVDLKFSINLFISSLLDEQFVSWFVEKFSSYPELSKHIEIEISERNANEYISVLSPVLNRFAELGIMCCVEHFGSPDENLHYLDALPVSRVKIDRRIVYDIYQNKEQQVLLKTMLINLKSRGIVVIAEGVEKEKDAEYLKECDIDGAQGFYFSRPERLKRIEKYLKVV